MLSLRILLLMLAILYLMDGHKEVMSATTGTKHQKEASDVQEKPEPEKKKIENGSKKTGSQNKTLGSLDINSNLQTLDRKKKKSKPKKKASRKKPNRPKKNKPNKPGRKTTRKPAARTPTPTTTTTTTTTTSTVTTSTPATKSTSSPTTSTPITAAPGECKTTGGSPCIFPFKDGGKEYNECADQDGRYYWCATKLRPSGAYLYWSYCATDGTCPLEEPEPEAEGCKAINNKPCKFPFKDGSQEYNECADFRGAYFWCATSTNSEGKFTSWEKCPNDGSCPLEGQTAVPSTSPTPTTISSVLPTTGISAVPNEIENKVDDTLQNLVLGESRSSSSQIFNLLDKKLETIIGDIEGKLDKRDQNSSGAIGAFEKKLPASEELTPKVKVDQAATDGEVGKGRAYEDGWMFVLSTVDAMKSVTKVSDDCCSDCRERYADTELAEYWKTFNICYCYKRIEGVEPMIRISREFSSSDCGGPMYCCSCNAKRENKIVGGGSTNQNEHPWMAYVFTPKGSGCGGSLISQRWVLTAAHCKGTRVALGLHNKDSIYTDPNVRIMEISYKLQPPKYQAPVNNGKYSVPGNLAEDILLIYMKDEVQLSQYIQPIEIYDNDILGIYVFRPEETLTVYGWGYQNFDYSSQGAGPNTPTDVLRKVNLNIMNVKQCMMEMDSNIVEMWYQTYMKIYAPVETSLNENGFWQQWKFCAESASSTVGAGCYGDSGSPLVVSIKGLISDTLYVVGVLSHGTDCASNSRPPNLCGLSKSTVFTNVNYYAKMIKNIISG